MVIKGWVSRVGQVGRAMSRSIAALIILIAVAGGSVYAAEPENINLMVGRSAVIDTGSAIQRVSLTSADVADALVTSSAQLLVHGKMPGTISMFVWDRGGAIRRYDVTVQRDLSRLTTQVHELFPNEHISVEGNGRSIVVAGIVSTKFVAEKAVEVAAGYVDKKEDVVNLLQVQEGGVPAKQVLLRVRFAEVSRSAMTELGVSWFTGPTGIKNTLARVTTQQFAAPGFDALDYTKPNSNFGTDPTSASGKFTFSDFLNLFLFSEKFDLGMAIKALQTKGLFQSLAEPNLVAESGKEASFLAGGEFPIPIAQGSGANIGVSVVFKEFGIRLNFTPTVAGDRVHLKVRPEVSTLDFTNAVTLGGFRIPALSTRRTETEVELQDGQTFAIAGLLNNTLNSTLQKIPGIGDIPILGLLFKSKAAQKNQTELVVMITPQILDRGSSGVAPTLPRTLEPFLPQLPDKKTIEPAPPAFRPQPSGEAHATTPVPASLPAPQQIAPASPAAAATALSALTPSGPRIADPVTAAPAPLSAKPAPAAQRPLAAPDQKVLDRARRQEAEKAREKAVVDQRASAAEAKRQTEQAAEEERKAAKDRVQQEKVAREQAKRDAENAKRAEEAARRQAEIDRRQQKVIEAASEKLKAAETAYQAELAKKSTQQ